MNILRLGKVVVAAAGTPIQLGKTTLSGDITAGATMLTVGSNNACPNGGLYRIDNEVVLATARGGTGNKDWTIRRAQNGTDAATHANGAAIYSLLEFSAIKAMVIAGLTGKCYLGGAGLDTLTDFWMDVAVNGEGLITSIIIE